MVAGVNTRLYLTNGHKFVLNASTETDKDSKKYNKLWQPNSAGFTHFDGTTDSVAMLRGFVVQGAVYTDNTINVNITQYDTAGSAIDLSTLDVVVAPNSKGILKVSYGSKTAALEAGDSFENEYSERTTGSLSLDPAILNETYAFYGKVTLTYNVYTTGGTSSTVTSTIYFLPYPSMRITKIQKFAVTNSGSTYSNDAGNTSFIMKSDGTTENISVTFSNSNQDTDSIAVFSSEATIIADYIDTIIKNNVQMDRALVSSVTLDSVVVANSYFGIKSQNKLNISWGSTDDTIITFSTDTRGTYVGIIEFYTQFNIKFGSSLKIIDTKKIYASIELSVVNFVMKGDVDFVAIDESTNDFVVGDATVGYISCFRYANIPAICIVSITTGEDIEVDLADDTYFKFAVNVVIENKSENQITVLTTNDPYVGFRDHLYVVSTSGVTIDSGNKRMFLRILFDPVTWEPSSEYSIES